MSEQPINPLKEAQSKGGKAKNPRKGFGSATPAQRLKWQKKAVKKRLANAKSQFKAAGKLT